MSNAVHIEAIAERPLSIIKQAGIVICASAVIAVCARIMVPPYIAAGTRVVILTEDFSYHERAKD